MALTDDAQRQGAVSSATAVSPPSFDPLSDHAPHLSARTPITSQQARVLIALAAGAGIALILAWRYALMGAGIVAGALIAAMITVRYAAALAPRWGDRAPDGADDILPHYSILCPAFREPRALPGLIAALDQLDYPRDRLDVIVLTERSDPATRAVACDAAATRAWLRVVEAPPVGPQTKPKALNIGLALARGDLLTVYDAEDRPHPEQLRAAAAAFARNDGRLACVQAPLTAYNGKEHWIAGQFALEYKIQFGYVLPLLARLGWPILLGGTSNHFRGLM